jgi:hypothetical protein
MESLCFSLGRVEWQAEARNPIYMWRQKAGADSVRGAGTFRDSISLRDVEGWRARARSAGGSHNDSALASMLRSGIGKAAAPSSQPDQRILGCR